MKDDDDLIDAEPSPGDAGPDDDQSPGREALAGPAAAGHGLRIASIEAKNFRDAHTIGEYFRQDIPVIINLTGMSTADAKRIVDFASGLIFGRRGDIERLSSRVFILLPPRWDLLKERGPQSDKGFFNQD
ncbi:MAG: cell division protein SepF [Streptosporangiaceae bacterium]